MKLAPDDSDYAEDEDSLPAAVPTQAVPKTLAQKSKQPVSGSKVNPAKPSKKIKVTSTDDLRSIYKKKYGKTPATLAEGDTAEGENEDYTKL